MTSFTDEQISRLTAINKQLGIDRAAAFVIVGSIPLAILSVIFGGDVSPVAAVIATAAYCGGLCAIAGATL